MSKILKLAKLNTSKDMDQLEYCWLEYKMVLPLRKTLEICIKLNIL